MPNTQPVRLERRRAHMAKQEIVANVEGVMRRPVPGAPLVSSSSTPWEGFKMEQHYTPPVMEFPRSIKFLGHMVALYRCEKPARLVHRVEGGMEREFAIPDGGLGMCSSQEIAGARQYGASMTFPLLIEGTTMDRIVAEAHGAPRIELIQRAGVEDQILQNLMWAMAADLMSGCPTGRIFGESLATAIGAYVAGKYSIVAARFTDYRNGLSKQRLTDVIDYIQSNLSTNLGVADIARVALMSPFYFGKLFKQSTGHTPHQYVLEQRVRKAQILLANTDLPLIQVASAIGMANQSHFTSMFKAKLGITPRQYRSQIQSPR
jgi:AraC family transcriptional regulator